jgi:cytochrome c-type biogenesis protein
MSLDIVLIIFAFSAGTIAFLNPCGFAMLPTYISYFIEGNSQSQPQPQRVSIYDNTSSTTASRTRSILVKKLYHGFAVGLLATGGFIAIFGFVGISISFVGIGIIKFFPWFGVLSGIVIISIGIAKMFGKTFHVNIPIFKDRIIYSGESNKATNPIKRRRIYLTSFLFGIGYALASLSCTLPIFLLVIFQGLSTGGVTHGSIISLTYALGMGIVMIAVSLAISLSNQTFLMKWLTKLMPKMNIITSIVLILAGSYLLYYNLIIGKLVY